MSSSRSRAENTRALILPSFSIVLHTRLFADVDRMDFLVLSARLIFNSF